MSVSSARDALSAVLLATRPGASATTLEDLPPDEVAAALNGQPEAVIAQVLEAMLPQAAARALESLGSEAHLAVARMSSPRAVAVIRWLDDDERSAIVDAIAGGAGREIRDALVYPDNTAGSLMDPRVHTARLTDTAGQALAQMKGVTKALYQIYVVDADQALIGVVPIQDLALAPADQRIEALVKPEVNVVDAFADADDVAALLSRTGTPAIAVIDSDKRLVGALRYRALLGIAEADAAQMMQQMMGVSPDEKALSPVRVAVKKRLPWLNINLLTAFLAAAVVGLFEGTIAKVTSLAILLPVVAGQSGNSGSQALAVTMRGLALREIRAAHWPRVAAKEILVGLSNGVAIAFVTAIGVYVWSRSAALSGVIAVSMILSMAAAGLAGASIPIILKRLGQDPAQSSSIILTTVTDVVGFSSFLGLATLLADRLV